MSLSRALKVLVVCFAIAMATSVATAAPTSAQINQMEQDISSRVYCMCGCATELKDCPDLHCPVKAKMHKIIRADLEEGKSEQATIQDLVAIYGEKVLSAPPARGFNLTAWVLPGVALLVGLFLAITVVRRWRKPAVQTATTGATPPANDGARAAVEEEMKKFID